MKFDNKDLQNEVVLELSKKLAANEELTEKECFDILFSTVSDLIRNTVLIRFDMVAIRQELSRIANELL